MYITVHPSNDAYESSSNVLGLRGFVVMYNEHNVPAKFQWKAQEGTDTDAFYAMHPTGESQTPFMAFSLHSIYTNSLCTMLVLPSSACTLRQDLYVCVIMVSHARPVLQSCYNTFFITYVIYSLRVYTMIRVEYANPYKSHRQLPAAYCLLLVSERLMVDF